jgi:hypothetical protein
VQSLVVVDDNDPVARYRRIQFERGHADSSRLTKTLERILRMQSTRAAVALKIKCARGRFGICRR